MDPAAAAAFAVGEAHSRSDAWRSLHCPANSQLGLSQPPPLLLLRRWPMQVLLRSAAAKC
jgi:hypothetical protein